jgi:hypothetical protein
MAKNLVDLTSRTNLDKVTIGLSGRTYILTIVNRNIEGLWKFKDKGLMLDFLRRCDFLDFYPSISAQNNYNRVHRPILKAAKKDFHLSQSQLQALIAREVKRTLAQLIG